jgi:uncharacterized protein
MAKPQILFVHGGMTFRTRKDYLKYLKTREVQLKKKNKWNYEYLDKKLSKNFQVIKPQMPLKENARYEDWKIHFERHIPFLNNNIILIGSSLGGIFLAKYLSENKFPKKIKAVYLIAPPYDNTLSEEDLTNGFRLKKDLSLLEKNTGKLILLFSKTDDVVPVGHADKYRKKLKEADIITYTNKKGHFQDEEFPELIKMLKQDAA